VLKESYNKKTHWEVPLAAKPTVLPFLVGWHCPGQESPAATSIGEGAGSGQTNKDY
jgi:hypothetical protein